MMKKQSIILQAFLIISAFLASCGSNSGNKENNPKDSTALAQDSVNGIDGQTSKIGKDPLEFCPTGYAVIEKIPGDLNKDGIDDCILMIKEKNKSNFEKNSEGTLVDRNRRGIVVLLNKNGIYEQAVKNYSCFSSENEDGGVYVAPELSVEIKKNNLYVGYAHGRYGQWKYTFRLQNSDFELIGYDNSENDGPRINSKTSINFLSKKKQIKTNTNENAEGGDEVFEETWENIRLSKLIKLSEIKDFDELDMSYNQ
jgi:hypothetical protein